MLDAIVTTFSALICATLSSSGPATTTAGAPSTSVASSSAPKAGDAPRTGSATEGAGGPAAAPPAGGPKEASAPAGSAPSRSPSTPSSISAAASSPSAPATPPATTPTAAPSSDGSNETPAPDAVAPSDTKTETKTKTKTPWIRRFAVRRERHLGELGVYGGILMPTRQHELFAPDVDLPEQGFVELRRVAPAIGARVGYYPFAFLGVEGEASLSPTRTVEDAKATLWGIRVSAVGQLTRWSIAPFALVGTGLMGVNSHRDALGSDFDAEFHFGGGIKAYVHRNIALRLEARDYLTAGRGLAGRPGHNPEVLLGLSVVLGRKRPTPPPADTDRDGYPDAYDQCVDVAGLPKYGGCPIPDSDADGVLDPDDLCLSVPGVAQFGGCPDSDADGIPDADDECAGTPGLPQYAGCPDSDGDTVPDPEDACVEAPGVPKLRGCPDTDGDDIADEADQCIEARENLNGYRDQDGCPDLIPTTIKKLQGVIKSITFEKSSAKLNTKSSKTRKTLERIRKAMASDTSFALEISGHTDITGDRTRNVMLSQARADAVKQWLVEHGVEAARLTTKGVGPDDPIASNDTKKGRQANRRIEIDLVIEQPGLPPVEPQVVSTLPPSPSVP